MDSVLFELVRDRVAADPPPGRAGPLVLAACRGDEALRDALEGADDAGAVALPDPCAGRAGLAWLSRLTVQGFRGIGPSVTLDLDAGPGLVLITGRNGSGKSSLSEALETVLRGTFRRWDDGSFDAKSAWRNLHGSAPYVALEVLRDGERLRVERTWAADAKLDDGAAVGPEVFTPAELDVRNPFLAYSDLGALFSGRPSDLHDHLSRILGLGSLGEALDRLRGQHKARSKALAEAKADATALAERLRTSSDPRAVRVLQALVGAWDLDAIEAVVAEPAEGSDPDARRDQAIRDWVVPTRLDVAAVRLEELDHQRAGLEREMAGRAQRLATLLREALAWPDATCPVCETPGVLDARWRVEAQARLAAADDDAEALRRVESDLRAAREAVRVAFGRPPGITDADLAALGDASPWHRWAEGRALAEPLALARHLDERAEGFLAWLEALQRDASARLAAAEVGWRPLRSAIAAWVGDARAALDASGPVRDLIAAEKWLGAAEEVLRAERFEPIAREAKAIWHTLRQESSVELVAVRLESRRQRRKVDLDVRIDDEDAPALGVMSQGELMSLALGLFIPRLASDDSPFGFVVIDDPVQSMDPHKVDGLALVLADLAKTRQVVVLTHDTRLRDALVRLAIAHRAWRVERGKRSAVRIDEMDHPVEMPLNDAARVLADGEALGDGVVRGVVPGFCREALEIALTTRVRRQRLARGVPHADVEDALRKAKGTRSLAALALFDDVRSREDVEKALVALGGPESAGVYGAIAEGSHTETKDDLKALVRKTRDLARKLVELGS